MPCFFYWLYLEAKKGIRHPFIRFVVSPFLFLVLISAGLYSVYIVAESSDYYQLDNIENRVSGFHNWHGQLAEKYDASGYSLGEDVELTPGGILKKFIPAVIVGLFRPFLWEVRKVVQLLSAMENFVYLLLFLILFFRLGLWKFYRLIVKNPLIVFSLLYAVIFAFVVGFTSYNFGALVRYKIPLMPFLGAALALMFQYSKVGKKTRG
ncbi:MAG: hypothetical protein D6707_00490 [Bacteroidetes bacterium]|nr:MAG: hypothetical protein D6707_00490 [Bacteroidota bacterium]